MSKAVIIILIIEKDCSSVFVVVQYYITTYEPITCFSDIL